MANPTPLELPPGLFSFFSVADFAALLVRDLCLSFVFVSSADEHSVV